MHRHSEEPQTTRHKNALRAERPQGGPKGGRSESPSKAGRASASGGFVRRLLRRCAPRNDGAPVARRGRGSSGCSGPESRRRASGLSRRRYFGLQLVSSAGARQCPHTVLEEICDRESIGRRRRRNIRPESLRLQDRNGAGDTLWRAAGNGPPKGAVTQSGNGLTRRKLSGFRTEGRLADHPCWPPLFLCPAHGDRASRFHRRLPANRPRNGRKARIR